MTQDEIIKMAWDSGAYTHRLTMWGFSLEDLERFAKLVAAKAIAELENQEPVKYEHKAYTMPVCPKCRSFFCDHTCKAIAELESQEPVAWLEPEWGEKICPEVGYEITMTDDHPRDLCWIPLYAHPPQRTWVGLTDDEFNELYDKYVPLTCYALLIEKVEAKLKEKNT